MIAVDVQPNLPAARVPYGDPRLGVLVARRVWPSNPCNGHEQVTTRWKDRAQYAHGAAEGILMGVADLAGKRCLVWINPYIGRERTCAVIVHEEGHWNGLSDNEPGYPVMAQWDDYVPPVCRVPS